MKVELVVFILLLAYSVASESYPRSYFKRGHPWKDDVVRRHARSASKDLNLKTESDSDHGNDQLSPTRQRRSATEKKQRNVKFTIMYLFTLMANNRKKDTEKWLGGVLPAFNGEQGQTRSKIASATTTTSTTTVPPTTPPNKDSPTCFAGHAAYVAQEEGGCPSASEFVSSVCRPFQDCMGDKRTSYWMCKPMLVDLFRA
ncbi:hypothetical protein COOONC_10813 [Cooperia oncophora]